MHQIIQLIGDKWVFAILTSLFFDQVRFSRLKKDLRITSRTLSRKLKSLEEKGIVQKICDDAGHTAYSLTNTGKEIFKTLSTLFS
jgi:DNA-binding HxlR family transcriptional regulator